MAGLTVGGRTPEQLMTEVVAKASANAIATATLAGVPVTTEERAALRAGAAAGCMTLWVLLSEAKAVRLDGDS